MNKIFTVFLIATICGVFSGCTSASAKADVVTVVVTNEIKFTHKGTRSEGRSGYLKINGILLPDCFSKAAVDGKVYTFKTKNTMWGDDGYFLLQNASVESVFPSVSGNLSDDDILKGWSEVSGRYSNVPAHWVFVKWETGSAAVSPEKIIEFVKFKSLKNIPRNSLFSGKMLK